MHPKIIFFLITFLFTSFILSVAKTSEAESCSLNPEIHLVRAIDGDTFETDFKVLNLKPFQVRVFGIDTPEHDWRAKCEKEKQLGILAMNFAKELLTDPKNTFKIEPVQFDKFGSRIDSKIFVNGKDYNQILIEKGLARPYFGEQKSDWCK